MPGSGKTTLTNLLAKRLDKKIITGDQYYDYILQNPQLTISRLFCKESNLGKDQFIPCLGSEEFIKNYGEQLFRDFEACVNIDLLEKNRLGKSLLDLGGKVFINTDVRKKLKELNYTSVYLHVDKDSLLERLIVNDNWKKRSVYRIAEEEGFGWKTRFLKDFEERNVSYKMADIIYSINSSELAEKTLSNILKLIK